MSGRLTVLHLDQHVYRPALFLKVRRRVLLGRRLLRRRSSAQHAMRNPVHRAAPLIYLRTTTEAVAGAGCDYVFTDGHGLAAMTRWFDTLDDLDEVDWSIVNQRYWRDKPDDNDRQRRKQAEFLVHSKCAWSLIEEISVLNGDVKRQVEAILADFPECHRPPVAIRGDWYYY